MDTDDLIRRLEDALSLPSLDRKDRRFIEACLPELRAGTLDPADRAELEAIATALDAPTDDGVSVGHVAPHHD